MIRTFVAAALAAGLAGPALASSDDAWAAFATEVKTACAKAVKGSLKNARIAVDPFGSENFGLAIASNAQASIVCVFDKKTKRVEIGSELGPETIKASIPKK